MSCRICGATAVTSLGNYHSYRDYCCEIYHCDRCLCRFTTHDQAVYEQLHRAPASSYTFQHLFAQQIAQLFAVQNRAAMRHLLLQNERNKFVITTVEQAISNREISPTARLLEIGCSLGYLTAYFIAAGCRILGVDVAPSAIEQAEDLFGPHFVTPDSPRVQEGDPYDVIYHVGTIGCVDDPIGMTNRLLDQLRPGGLLLFNAPNVAFCQEHGLLWTPSTGPPDLVTLFDASFWSKQFTARAHTTITYAPGTLSDRLRKLMYGPNRAYVAEPQSYLFDGRDDHVATVKPHGATMRNQIRALLQWTGVEHLLPSVVTEFGMLVRMQKR